MTPFKFSLPPKTPGVYAFKHEPTGMLYIGSANSLHRRFSEWRSVILSGSYHKAHVLAEALKDTRIEDWTFYVVAEYATADEALEMEHRIIAGMAERAPASLLNSNGYPGREGGVGRKPPVTGNVPLSVVTDTNGKRYTYTEAADALGCPKSTLIARLAKYRAKGTTSLTLDFLRERKVGRPPAQL